MCDRRKRSEPVGLRSSYVNIGLPWVGLLSLRARFHQTLGTYYQSSRGTVKGTRFRGDIVTESVAAAGRSQSQSKG